MILSGLETDSWKCLKQLGSLHSSQDTVWLWSINSCNLHYKTPVLNSGWAVKGKGEHLCQRTNHAAIAFLWLGGYVFRCYRTLWRALVSRYHKGVAMCFLLLRGTYPPATGEGWGLCSGSHLLFHTRQGKSIPKPLLAVQPTRQLVWSCHSQHPWLQLASQVSWKLLKIKLNCKAWIKNYNLICQISLSNEPIKFLASANSCRAKHCCFPK